MADIINNLKSLIKDGDFEIKVRRNQLLEDALKQNVTPTKNMVVCTNRIVLCCWSIDFKWQSTLPDCATEKVRFYVYRFSLIQRRESMLED